MFCSKCGNALNENVKFCSLCGAPVFAGANANANVNVPPPPPANVPPPPLDNIPPVAQSEPVIAAIPVRLKKGVFQIKRFVMVFTQQQLLFSYITPNMQKEMATLAKNEAKSRGKGILGQMAATISSSFNIYERYFDMSVQQIMQENSENFTIPHNCVTKIKFNRGRFERNEETETYKEGVILIKTVSATYKFILETSREEKELERLLSGIYEKRFSRGFIF